MLVLSRRIGEQVIINDDIVVTVVSIKGNQVRLGFTAPTEVSICREELLTGESGRAAKRGASGGVHDTVSEMHAPADLRGAGRDRT